ncbi:unnamed protein product [Rotaria sordida]|uniref:Uncharacterized protein n=1 Tax=Rotaria sordida TaxID=392033 RepID=A0A815J010_9BILA|nr:unnamed protein product [Rotaria sordida]CAF1370262.1 unnamed protein product [Rotaria sordida]
MSSLKTYFINLNIFKSSSNGTNEENEHEHRSNIIATRTFLIIFILTLILLALFYGMRNQTRIVTLQHPAIDQFKSLPMDAHCPCSRISLSYGEFVAFETRFHQVCSSDFVSDRWIKAINSGSNSTYFFTLDFRTDGSAIFQALASLCHLSKDNTIQSIASFTKESFISPQVLSESVFRLQVNVSIEQFQSTASNGFENQLELVQKMISGNTFISALPTNSYFKYFTINDQEFGLAEIYLIFRASDDALCYCTTDVDCQTDSWITNLFGEPTVVTVSENAMILMEIPGFVHSCLPMNAILLSTLECFYNQTCLDTLLSFFATNEAFKAMTILEESRFELNSTVTTMIANLMIEKWITNISYNKYYTKCAPIFCTYSLNEKNDWMFVLIKLISLLGGLTFILGFVIQKSVAFIRRPRNLRNPRNTESMACKSNFSIYYLSRVE